MIQDYLIQAYKEAEKDLTNSRNQLVIQTVYRLLARISGELPDELIANYKPRKKRKIVQKL